MSIILLYNPLILITTEIGGEGMKDNQVKIYTSPNEYDLYELPDLDNLDPDDPDNIRFPRHMMWDRNLSLYAKVVYMLLPSSGGWDNSEIHTDEEIGGMLGFTVPEVQKYKKELIKTGYTDEEGRLP